jgi:peptidoglycan hydrolase CwlO-like protein
MERRLSKMKKLPRILLIGIMVITAGASMTSCKNETNREGGSRVAAQEAKIAGGAEKNPTLTQIVDYQNTVEAKLDKLDKQIEKLNNQAGKFRSETRAEFKEEIEELNWKKAYAHKKLDELKSASEETWKHVRSEMDSTMDDLEKSYESTVSRLR